jgi:dihydrodipicolinate synthase/N-acetylneuraminate lyase
MPMLLIGCDGGTNATSGVVPEITRRLYDLGPPVDEASCNKLGRCST